MDSLAGWGFLIWCVVGGGGGIVDKDTLSHDDGEVNNLSRPTGVIARGCHAINMAPPHCSSCVVNNIDINNDSESRRTNDQLGSISASSLSVHKKC